jgi:hypothetical protein
MNEFSGIDIRETYNEYSPFINVQNIVERLVAALPPRFLFGLKTIVLTNTSNLNHDRRREKIWYKGRKYQTTESFALYHAKTKDQDAWIEIFVDKMLTYLPKVLFRIPVIRDMFIANVLYHEVGHHFQRSRISERKETEGAAQDWSRDLGRAYFRRKYWYLIPIVWICKSIVKMLKAFAVIR